MILLVIGLASSRLMQTVRAPSIADVEAVARDSPNHDLSNVQFLCTYDAGRFKPGYSFQCISDDEQNLVSLTVLNSHKGGRFWFLASQRYINRPVYSDAPIIGLRHTGLLRV
jgi:hypothetical protein